MSVQDEINRINQNVANTYSALRDMGATLPDTQNSNNMANAVRTIPQSGDSGSASSFRVTATANLTSATGGTLTGLTRSFEEIEAANTAGKCVVLDVDISQMYPNQRAAMPLVSYMSNALLLFGGSIYTGEVCMQLTCILDTDGNALLFINQLATAEDLAGLGGGGGSSADNSFTITADYTPSMDSSGNITVTVAKLSATYFAIKTAYDSGKDIKFIASQAIGNTNDRLFFTMATISDLQISFTATAPLGAALMFVSYVINSDGSTSCVIKTIT